MLTKLLRSTPNQARARYVEVTRRSHYFVPAASKFLLGNFLLNNGAAKCLSFLFCSNTRFEMGSFTLNNIREDLGGARICI